MLPQAAIELKTHRSPVNFFTARKLLAMEVPAGQDGIQQLLLAEQEAQAIVAQARKGKHYAAIQF